MHAYCPVSTARLFPAARAHHSSRCSRVAVDARVVHVEAALDVFGPRRAVLALLASPQRTAAHQRRAASLSPGDYMRPAGQEGQREEQQGSTDTREEQQGSTDASQGTCAATAAAGQDSGSSVRPLQLALDAVEFLLPQRVYRRSYGPCSAPCAANGASNLAGRRAIQERHRCN